MQAESSVTVEDYVRGIQEFDRGILARAITLVESRKPEDMALAQELLVRLMAQTGDAVRVGITGVPGVGKSTFIDALGTRLIDDGHRVAVLAVDPSSSISGGSILGDKSRMPRLAAAAEAFIRPSPNALSLGGVTRRTRETMLLCEAAGFDVILVETVGVGQSETVVADMVDCFLVLVLAGAGDELQGIKKGIIELADLVAVNKADGDNLERAQLAKRDYAAALRYLGARPTSWEPRVVTVSGLTGAGMAELWELV
ncbi:MAG: methylmalonyl Co-A mutase-associated GTPase MeaB, partial [Thermoanaerobaculia bacterium]